MHNHIHTPTHAVFLICMRESEKVESSVKVANLVCVCVRTHACKKKGTDQAEGSKGAAVESFLV